MEYLRLFLRRHMAGKPRGGVANCRLFSQTSGNVASNIGTFNVHELF